MSQIFIYQHRVIFAECTIGNHIYHSRYLDILEAARGEFLRHLGVTLKDLYDKDMVFPVIETQLRYKAPARYDDVIDVQLWLSLLKGIRSTFEYKVLRQDGTLVIEGSTTHVCTTRDEQPRKVERDLVEKLRPYLKVEAVAV